MNRLRILAGGLVAALALPWQSMAANTEYSDLWWNPAESGWGVGLQRQDGVIFLTLFVYGADGSSTWFVAPDVRLQGEDIPASTWQGALYRATGPGFMATYDQAVQAVQTGSATIEFASAEAATLRYSVDGVHVTKQISRMTWRQPSAAGTYHGGFSAEVSQCEVDPTRVGVYDFLGNMTVTQAGERVVAAFSTSDTGEPSSCTFTASARQAGRLGFWSGTFSCSVYTGCDMRCEGSAVTRRAGTFTLDRVAVTESGFRGKLTARDQDCEFTGSLGGTRKP